MSKTTISPALRQQVSKNSRYRCSYCLTQEEVVGMRFTIDHIIPESLGGSTTSENLCLACWEQGNGGLSQAGIRHQIDDAKDK